MTKGQVIAVRVCQYYPKRGKEEVDMKYLVAWALGVPGVLVLAWFVISHH